MATALVQDLRHLVHVMPNRIEGNVVKLWRPDLDYGYAEGGIAEDQQGSAFEEVYLGTHHGEPVLGQFSNLKMEISLDPPDAQPDYFTCGTMLMVSEPLKALLEEFTLNVQYIPFDIIPEGKEVPDRVFYYCRILDVVECFDFDRGEYTFFQKEGFYDRVDQIKKLVIDEKKADGYHLFRIAKGGERFICVSDALANRIEEGGFRGIKFVPPEEWNC